MPALRELWQAAGLLEVATHEITVQRTFADFDTWWNIARTGPRLASTIAALTPDQTAALKGRMAKRLRPAADGRIACSARANAIQGRVGPKSYRHHRPAPA